MRLFWRIVGGALAIGLVGLGVFVCVARGEW